MNAISPLFSIAMEGASPRFVPETLIFTAQDLPRGKSHVIPLILNANQTADSLMKAVADWLVTQQVFDQRDVHGDNWSHYKITGYCQYNGPNGHRSIISDVFLSDHVFPNCRDYTAGSFDEFMRILDRHKIAEQMHRDLMYYSDFDPQAYSGRTWLEGFRACCHPDHPRPETVAPQAGTGGGWPASIAAAPM